MTSDIRTIWKQVCDGDSWAWRELVRLYAGLVNTVALGAGLSVPDAEDCAQHTWIALYRGRHHIKDPASLPAWLIRTTRRRAVYMARRLLRDTELEVAGTVVSADRLPDEEVQQLEYQAVLEAGLRQLDPRCQELIHDLYLSPQKKSYQEVAKSLGISPNSLGPLRSRCLARLRKILRKMGYSLD